MADGRDVKVWTNHAHQHRDIKQPHTHHHPKLRGWLEQYKPLGSLVLDLGCGSGLWVPMFSDYDYHGVDQNAEMIKVANERWPDMTGKFQQMTWDRIPFEDGSVDVVFTSAVLQHNKHDQKEKVVREICRVLKPDGIYLCTENTFREDNYQIAFPKEKKWRPDLQDAYSFTSMGWKKWMQPRGLEQVEFEFPGEYVYRKV